MFFLASEEDTEPVRKPRVLPGDEPARVEEFRRTSTLCVGAPYERIRPASKVKIQVHLNKLECRVKVNLFQ